MRNKVFLLLVFFIFFIKISFAAYVCDGCSQPLTGKYFILNGKNYCENCYIQSLPKCDGCGASFTSNYWTINGKKYCQNCYDKFSLKCDNCGQTLSGKYNVLEGKNYCDSCYGQIATRCRICNEIITGSYVSDFSGKYKYCKNCYDSYPHCSNCGVPVGTMGVKLGDGRSICPDCYGISVFTQNVADNLFENVKKDMAGQLKLKVNFPVKKITLVDKTRLREIQKNQNIEYAPEDKVSGIHYYEKLDGNVVKSEIYILNGLTPERAFCVIAHEYAHAWQSENCPDGQDIKVREGFAEWVSYKMARAKGYEEEAGILLKTSDPVYGAGLKEIIETEKKYGEKGVLNFVRTGDPKKEPSINVEKKFAIKEIKIKNFPVNYKVSGKILNFLTILIPAGLILFIALVLFRKTFY